MNVHWEIVYSVENADWRCKLFYLITKIDQSKTTKSYMFNVSLNLVINIH